MIRKIALAALLGCSLNAWAGDAETETLYQRLGGAEGVETIVRGTIDRHMENPEVVAYFQHIDHEWLIQSVIAFFSAGTGGPSNYTGADMVTAHAHLKLNDAEFDAAVADVLDSVKASGASQSAHDEVAAILESFRPQVVAQG